jgi:uncharacterized membrane-anchored protein
MKIVLQCSQTMELESELEVDSPDQLREMLKIDALDKIDNDNLYDFIIDNGEEVYNDSSHEVTIYVRDDNGRSWSARNLGEAVKMYNDQLHYQKDEELTKAGQLKLFK